MEGALSIRFVSDPLQNIIVNFVETKQVLFFNKSGQEQVRSIFHNRLNQSVIIVSVTTKDDCNSLKCRSVPI